MQAGWAVIDVPPGSTTKRSAGAAAKHLLNAASIAATLATASATSGASGAGGGNALSPATSALAVAGVRVSTASLPSASRSVTPPTTCATLTVSMILSDPVPEPTVIVAVIGLKVIGSSVADTSALAIAARSTSSLRSSADWVTFDGVRSAGLPEGESIAATALVNGDTLITTEPAAGNAPATGATNVTSASPSIPLALTTSGATRPVTSTEYLPSAATLAGAVTVLPVLSVTLTVAPTNARPTAATPSTVTLCATGAGAAESLPPPQAESNDTPPRQAARMGLNLKQFEVMVSVL